MVAAEAYQNTAYLHFFLRWYLALRQSHLVLYFPFDLVSRRCLIVFDDLLLWQE